MQSCSLPSQKRCVTMKGLINTLRLLKIITDLFLIIRVLLIEIKIFLIEISKLFIKIKTFSIRIIFMILIIVTKFVCAGNKFIWNYIWNSTMFYTNIPNYSYNHTNEINAQNTNSCNYSSTYPTWAYLGLKACRNWFLQISTRANKFSKALRKFSKVENIEIFNWLNKKQTLLETFFRFFDSVCRASIGICVSDKSVEIWWPQYRGKTDFEIFCFNSKEILIKYFKIL